MSSNRFISLANSSSGGGGGAILSQSTSITSADWNDMNFTSGNYITIVTGVASKVIVPISVTLFFTYIAPTQTSGGGVKVLYLSFLPPLTLNANPLYVFSQSVWSNYQNDAQLVLPIYTNVPIGATLGTLTAKDLVIFSNQNFNGGSNVRAFVEYYLDDA